MFYTFRQKRLLAWLFAAIVFAGDVSPPAYGHAHAGGDGAHNHHSSGLPHAASHEHSPHSHAHSHANAHSHSADLGNAGEGPQPHLHASVLWFQFTVPMPHNDGSNPSPSEYDELPVVMRLIDPYVPGSPSESNVWLLETTTLWVLWNALEAPALSLSSYAQPTAASVLLCDTARRERSGVLRC